MYQAAGSGCSIRAQASSFLVRSAADRFAVYIVSMIDCDHDPKTIAGWARHANASGSTIREHCRLVQIKPHSARDFGRLLRAVYRSGRTWLPETVLDCADIRTLNKLMKHAGLTGKHGSLTPSISEFLEGQQWIPQNHPVMPILSSVLRLLPSMEPV
jgi:hypothetical protein